MSRDEYRSKQVREAAEHSGVSISQLRSEGQRKTDLQRRILELRYNRRDGWRAIACRAAAMGRRWEVAQ